MKRTSARIAIILFFVLGIALFMVLKPSPVWEENAEKFREAAKIQSNGASVSLAEVTPFEWDTAYAFKPYTSKERIYEVVGYQWDKISETVNEGMTQIVFMDKGKVVCYVYGYPNNLEYGFNFGAFEGDHLQLDRGAKPIFTVESANNIVYFTYKK